MNRPRSSVRDTPKPTATPAPNPAPPPAPPAKSNSLPDRLFSFLGKSDVDPATKQLIESQQKQREQDKKDAKKQREAIKNQAKADEAQVIYDDRLARMNSALEDMKAYLPAAENLHKAVTAAIAAGDKVLSGSPGKSDYAGAYKALHSSDFSLGKVLDQAKKAQDTAFKKAHDSYPDVFTVSDEIGRHLNAKPPITAKRIGEIADQRRVAVGLLVKGAVTKDVAAGVKATLSTLLQTLLTEKSAAEDYRGRMIKKTQEAKTAYDKAALLVTSQVAAPMLAKLNGAGSAMAEHDYAAAEATLDLVLQDAGAASAAESPFFDKWNKERDQLPALRKRVQEQRARVPLDGGKSQMPETSTRLLRLLDGLDVLSRNFPAGEVQREPGTLSYKDAVDTVTMTTADIDAIAKQIDSFNGFADARAKAREEMVKRFEAARKQIGTLEAQVAAVEDGLDPKLVSAPFRAELDRLEAEWNPRSLHAHDAASLNVEATASAISATEKLIAAASTGDGTSTAVAGAKAELAAKACMTAMADAKRAIDELAAYDIDEAAPHLPPFVALQKRVATRNTPNHYEQCAKDAATQTESARGKIVMLEGQVRTAQDALTRETTAIAGKLDIFWKGIEGIRGNAREDAYVKLHGTFTDALNSHRAVAKLQQLMLLEAALAEARTLGVNVSDTVGEFDKSIADKALSAVTMGRLGRGTNTATFDDVNKKVATQKERLKDKELRSFADNTAHALDGRLDAVLKAVGSASMAELVKQVGDIAVEITAAEALAKTGRQQYDAFKLQLADTAKLLDNKLFDHVPKVKKAFESSLQEIRADARQEGGLRNAAVQHTNVRREIVDGLKSPLDAAGVPQSFADGQKTLIADEEAKVKQRARWAGNVTVLEKGIDALPSTLSADKKSLRDRLATADKEYKKNDDYDAAWAQFSAIRNRMELLGQNPGGLKMHARGQLPGVRQRWVVAVGKLKSKLDELVRALNGVADDPAFNDAMKKLVTDELTAVRGMFNVSSFDKPVDVITRPGTDDKARSAAREQALREVRRMRELIRNDPRFRMLSQTPPMKMSFAGEISETSLALADMETNMLISL